MRAAAFFCAAIIAIGAYLMIAAPSEPRSTLSS